MKNTLTIQSWVKFMGLLTGGQRVKTRDYQEPASMIGRR